MVFVQKAAGLGRHEMAEYIVQRYPASVNLLDNEGRTPLHFAALVKDDDRMYDYLIMSGTDESALDNVRTLYSQHQHKKPDNQTTPTNSHITIDINRGHLLTM